MFEDAFGHGSNGVAGLHTFADFGDWRVGPLLLLVQRIDVKSFLQEISGLLGQFRQRILQAVIDLREQARAEFDGKQLGGEFDGIADFHASRAFENLQVCFAAAHADDFRFEAGAVRRQDVCDFVLHDGACEFNGDHVSVDACDFGDGGGFSHGVIVS